MNQGTSSRSFDDLREDFASRARNFQKTYQDRFRTELLITCTLRDMAAQAFLYEVGRSKPGHILTNAKPGDSFHNYGLAFDAVPVVGGKPLWEVFDHNSLMVPEWRNFGFLSREFNFTWAGNWTIFKEYAHMQDGNFTLQQLRSSQEK